MPPPPDHVRSEGHRARVDRRFVRREAGTRSTRFGCSTTMSKGDIPGNGTSYLTAEKPVIRRIRDLRDCTHMRRVAAIRRRGPPLRPGTLNVGNAAQRAGFPARRNLEEKPRNGPPVPWPPRTRPSAHEKEPSCACHFGRVASEVLAERSAAAVDEGGLGSPKTSRRTRSRHHSAKACTRSSASRSPRRERCTRKRRI